MRSAPSGQDKARLSFIPPQLATLVDKPPSNAGWIHEIKVDGWRIQLLVEGGTARVMTRRGHDWTVRFKQIATAAGGLPCRSAIIDGEAVVQDERGITSYDALIAGAKSPVMIAFDLLHLNGQDLRRLPLIERRERLADLLFGFEGPIGFSDAIEGIVSKKADSRYQSGRTKTWLKAKAWDEDVFTLIGFELNGEGNPIPLLAREYAGLLTFAGAALVGLCESKVALSRRLFEHFEMLVFIDESGDPGFKLSKGSSAVFVVALVAFRQIEQSTRAAAAIEAVAKRLRLPTEFKFSKSRPEVRDAFFKSVLSFDFCVRAIAVKKELLYSPHLRSDKTSFYSFFVKSMLKFDNGLLKDARVIIDGSGDQSFKKELAAYLRRHTGEGAVRKVRFSDSRSDRLVQMADMCAGAIARSYRAGRADGSRWREMLAPKIEDIWDFC